jgi:transcriptional regulator with XRE-family HTH domain
MKLSDNILSYRMEHNYSIRDFAKICDLSHVQVYFMERGLNSDGKPFVPTIATLKKLATGMGITFNELVSISDDLTDVRLEPDDSALSPENRTLMAWAASLTPEQAAGFCAGLGLTVTKG